jgi:tetratricopeptide (TPR) repeat protein
LLGEGFALIKLGLEKENAMTNSSSPKPRRALGCSCLIALLIIAVVGYSAIRYFIDWNNYKKGHQAYQQADCALAIHHFDTIINGWRLVDIGGYPTLAQQEKAECLPFQAAVAKQQAGDPSAALIAYADFVSGYSNSVLAAAARNRSASLFEQAKPSELASQESCQKIDMLLEQGLVPQRDVNLPPFYFACGQVYDSANNQQSSFAIYEALLTEYPQHLLAAEAEASLVTNPVACEESDSLKKNSVITERTDFMPSLYYHCGQAYEDGGDWANAIIMYESFLADYPSHSLASDVEVGLAQSIVAQAKVTSAGEIPAPERSGSTGSGLTEVVIQNDSPERLRIVFSGPESHVEELEACSSCITYTTIGPLYCPEQGPIGRYTLNPGQYDVVVESIGDSGTTPWTGNWSLVDGDEYYSCFFVVTTVSP